MGNGRAFVQQANGCLHLFRAGIQLTGDLMFYYVALHQGLLVGSCLTGQRGAMSPNRGLSWRYFRYLPGHCRAGRLAPQGAGVSTIWVGQRDATPAEMTFLIPGGRTCSVSPGLVSRFGSEGRPGLFGIADLIDVPAGVTHWRLHQGFIAHLFCLEQGAGHGESMEM